MALVNLQQVLHHVLCGIVRIEGGVCSKTNLVEENFVDVMFFAKLKSLRQTCERARFHTCSAFGAISAMSVPDV